MKRGSISPLKKDYVENLSQKLISQNFLLNKRMSNCNTIPILVSNKSESSAVQMEKRKLEGRYLLTAFETAPVQLAAAKLGLRKEDCTPRLLKDYIVTGVDQQIARLRCSYENKVVKDNIKELYEAKEAYKKMEKEMNNVQSPKLGTIPNQSKIRYQTPSPMRACLCRGNRQQVKEYLLKSWNMVKYDEYSRMSSMTARSQSQHSSRENTPLLNAPLRKAQILKPPSKIKYCCFVPPKLSSNPTKGIDESIKSEIKKKIELRAKEYSEVKQKLLQEDEKRRNSKELEDIGYNIKLSKIKKIENKIESAKDKAEAAIFSKLIGIVNTAPNFALANARRRNLCLERNRTIQEDFIERARTREERKRMAVLHSSESKTRLHQESEERKNNHKSNLAKIKTKEADLKYELKNREESRHLLSQRILSTPPSKDILYREELIRLFHSHHKNFQERRERMNNTTREALYNRHQSLDRRNRDKSRKKDLNYTAVLQKDMFKKQKKEKLLQEIFNIMHKSQCKEEVMKKLREFNEQYALGLSLI